jgi:uncharacterized protein YlxW (UPF0749 family)
MTLVFVIAILMVVVVLFTFVVRAKLGHRQQLRAEAARMDREVRSAERRLHNLASNAYSAMLDAARRSSSGGCEGHR